MADRPEYRTPEELWDMLDAKPTVLELPGGGYRVEKAGLVGVGRTRDAAIRDLADKFSVALTRPKV